jgi:hypothetical protein
MVEVRLSPMCSPMASGRDSQYMAVINVMPCLKVLIVDKWLSPMSRRRLQVLIVDPGCHYYLTHDLRVMMACHAVCGCFVQGLRSTGYILAPSREMAASRRLPFWPHFIAGLPSKGPISRPVRPHTHSPRPICSHGHVSHPTYRHGHI